jgi:hypothetical protein
VLVSDNMIAQTHENSWSKLLTSVSPRDQAVPIADLTRAPQFYRLSNVAQKIFWFCVIVRAEKWARV